MTTPTEIRELLVKTRDLLLNKEWCQGASARDANGDVIEVSDDKACSFCLLGALVKEAEGRNGLVDPARNVLMTAAQYTNGLVSWNDRRGRTKTEVIDLLDKSIEAV